MKAGAYRDFLGAKERFSALVERIGREAPWLAETQEALRLELGYDDYRIETPAVYNLDLDTVGPGDDPPFILVADNPGKNEQKTANRRYLVGQSGRLAAGWFARELGLDFRAATLIVNKTPVHTPKTNELRRLAILAGRRRAALEVLLEESQREMARIAFAMHGALGNTLWVSGYGELGSRGLFSAWAEEIVALYGRGAPKGLADRVWVFRHFSMNQFSIEYNAAMREDGGVGADPRAAMERLGRIGRANRVRILGF